MRCAVWDLDETLWSGIAIEHRADQPLPTPDKDALDLVEQLRARGIVSAIATRNPPSLRTRLMAEPWSTRFALIHSGWGRKAPAVAMIARELDFALEHVVYVDNAPFERAAVEHEIPQLRALSAADLRAELSDRAAPRADTAEARRRAEMYRTAMLRRESSLQWGSDHEAFLGTCEIVLALGDARPEHAERLFELVHRTNQYNSTGRRWTLEEIRERIDASAPVVVGTLRDRFGDYGLIAAAFVEPRGEAWAVSLLLISCRAAGKGCLGGMIHDLMRRAGEAGARVLEVETIATERNLPLRVALRAAMQPSVAEQPDVVRFTCRGDAPPPAPLAWLTLETW